MGYRTTPSHPRLLLQLHLLLQWFHCTCHNYLHHVFCLSDDVNPHTHIYSRYTICVFLAAGQKWVMSSFTSATLSTIC